MKYILIIFLIYLIGSFSIDHFQNIEPYTQSQLNGYGNNIEKSQLVKLNDKFGIFQNKTNKLKIQNLEHIILNNQEDVKSLKQNISNLKNEIEELKNFTNKFHNKYREDNSYYFLGRKFYR